ncbi:LLM class flavin-dependent oxidoreductase [Nocardiopsis alba]|uniref:LLM class flavin-dependent oxidoreductase n=1 Tax=Nocardiopsis alba TaxID=53437 RepID=UPI00366C3771
MSVDFYWRISMHGDQRSLTERASTRGGWATGVPGGIAPALRDGRDDGYAYIEHMADVARSAEAAGFYGGLMPSFPFTEDPWATAAMLARETRGFRFMIAFQPGFLNPVHTARMAASLQRATNGRVVYNVITGGGGPAQLWWGDEVAHDDRYARTSEFLHVHKGVWKERPYSFDGRFYRVENGALPDALAAEELPEIYFSGSSPAAIDAAGQHADHYLSWMEPTSALAEKFARVREHSAALGRSPRFAVRVDVVARATEKAAWDVVRRGFESADPEVLREWRTGDSVGAARSLSFIDGPIDDHRDLEVEPHVWGGFSLLRAGPAFGLVGSYEQVAGALDRLIGIGVDSFILAGVPHLEEAQRVGEEVLPLLRGSRTPEPVGRP